MSLGFASVPTALGFLVGAAGCAALGSVAPISFQAETVVMAGTMGKNMRERLSMVLFAGVTMAVLGACGLLTVITNFAGDVVLHAMMAGVGLVLTRLSLGMLKKKTPWWAGSPSGSRFWYIFPGAQSGVYHRSQPGGGQRCGKAGKAGHRRGRGPGRKNGQAGPAKPVFNLTVLRGALALACLTIGANIAFGNITGSMAGAAQNVDHLTIYSGLADAVSALFGGALWSDHLGHRLRPPTRWARACS